MTVARGVLLKYRIAGTDGGIFFPCVSQSAALLDGVPYKTPVCRFQNPSFLVASSQFSIENFRRMPLMLRRTCVLLPLIALTLSALAQESRHFTFHYDFTVKNLPAGKKVRIWIPAAQSDAYQEVKIVSAYGDLPLKKTREARFGNEIYFAEIKAATQPELHFNIEYDAVRHERVGLNPSGRVIAASLTSKERQEDLQTRRAHSSHHGRPRRSCSKSD